MQIPSALFPESAQALPPDPPLIGPARPRWPPKAVHKGWSSLTSSSMGQLCALTPNGQKVLRACWKTVPGF